MFALASSSMGSTAAASMIMLRCWLLDSTLVTSLGAFQPPDSLSNQSSHTHKRADIYIYSYQLRWSHHTRSHTWSHAHLGKATHEQIHQELELLEKVCHISFFFASPSLRESNAGSFLPSRLWLWFWVSSRCTSGLHMVCYLVFQMFYKRLRSLHSSECFCDNQ